jgi:hypothetical protein
MIVSRFNMQNLILSTGSLFYLNTERPVYSFHRRNGGSGVRYRKKSIHIPGGGESLNVPPQERWNRREDGTGGGA